MKILLSILFAALFAVGCSRDGNCVDATVTRQGTVCSNWGIKVGNNTWPSANIPASMQQEGLRVCVEYELYEDMRLCPCCGGTWARIVAIQVK